MATRTSGRSRLGHCAMLDAVRCDVKKAADLGRKAIDGRVISTDL